MEVGVREWTESRPGPLCQVPCSETPSSPRSLAGVPCRVPTAEHSLDTFWFSRPVSLWKPEHDPQVRALTRLGTHSPSVAGPCPSVLPPSDDDRAPIPFLFSIFFPFWVWVSQTFELMSRLVRFETEPLTPPTGLHSFPVGWIIESVLR